MHRTTAMLIELLSFILPIPISHTVNSTNYENNLKITRRLNDLVSGLTPYSDCMIFNFDDDLI